MLHLDKASNPAVQGAANPEEVCIHMMEDDPLSKLESADRIMLSAIVTHSKDYEVVEGGGRGNVNTAGIMQSDGRRGRGDTDSINYVDTVVDINEENVEDNEEETTSFIKKGLFICLFVYLHIYL